MAYLPKKQLRRLRQDAARELGRVQSQIRAVADRAARDQKDALRRGRPQAADYVVDRATRQVHELEDREVALERRIEDLDADIAQARETNQEGRR